MNECILCIGFNGYQVCVYSDVPEVIERIKLSFIQMVETGPRNVVCKLVIENGRSVFVEDEKYDISYFNKVQVCEMIEYLIINEFIKRFNGCMWFHAGAAARGGLVIMLPGPSGRGKSTLVTNLLLRDWTYLSDDIVAMDPTSGKVIPFPRTPCVRLHAGQKLPQDKVRGMEKSNVHLLSGAVCRVPTPIGALIFPNFSFLPENQLSRCPPATAAISMLQNCLNLGEHHGSLVRNLCAFVERLPVFHLSFNRGDLAADLIDHAFEEWNSQHVN